MSPEIIYRPTYIKRAIRIENSQLPQLDPRVTCSLPRINTGFEEEQNLYEGEVVSQSDQAICGVAAFLNAVNAAGGRTTPLMEDDIYRDAAVIDGKGKEIGIDLGTLQDIVSAYPEQGITVGAREEKDALMPVSLEELPLLTTYTVNVIQQNARTIKSTIDNGDTIVVLTKSPKSLDRHAVAVIGYTVDEYGFMSVQYADSNLGSVEMPLEYFSTMLVTFNDPEEPDSLLVHVDNPQIPIDEE